MQDYTIKKTTTRDIILDTCLQAIAKHGFNALRTDNEIKHIGITKGAFYHYFSTKTALGIAVFKERIEPRYTKLWKGVIANPQNFKEEYFQLLESEKSRVSKDGVCDVLLTLITENNLLEEDFRKEIEFFIETLLTQIQTSVRTAKAHGKINPNGDSKSQSVLLFNGTLSCYITPMLKQSSDNFSSSCNAFYKLMCDTFFTDQGTAMPFA